MFNTPFPRQLSCSPFAALMGLVGTLVLACTDPGQDANQDDDGRDGADDVDGARDGDADGGPEGEREGDSDDLTSLAFAPDHIIEIDVSMDPALWQQLSLERRSITDILGPGCLDAPFGSPFVEYPADVTIDGQTYLGVHIRKKGFLGSLSETKPSLKIDLNDSNVERTFWGIDKLTLNNQQQDESVIATCLAYAAFAAAGVPAPRCNFAHVTVNNEDLGVYAHVEEVKKQFLRRNFGRDDGNLYEGTLSDFNDEWRNTFEKDTNASDPSTPEIDAIIAALAVDDAEVLAELGAVIDLEAFYRFWAMEVLVGHWDGYSGNQNNFFLYGDPQADRAAFIPWGVDGTWMQEPTPTSITARSVLTERLYRLPTARMAYVEALQSILDTAWDESVMLADIGRMDALISPLLTSQENIAQDAALDGVRTFLVNRRAHIETELSGGPAIWNEPVREPICLARNGGVTASFTTTFGTWPTEDVFASGDGTFSGDLDGIALVASALDYVGAAAGFDPEAPPQTQVLVLVPAVLDDGRVMFAALVIAPNAFVDGVHDIDDIDVQVLLLESVNDVAEVRGLAYQGTLTLDVDGTQSGAAVTGSFEADLMNVWF